MDKLDKGRRVYLSVPYEEKDEAKKLGAKWNPQKQKWYIPKEMMMDTSKDVV